MGGLHPALTSLTIEMITLGEVKAEENLQSKLLTMNDSELDKIIQDADKMTKFSADISKKCGMEKYHEYLNNEKYNDLMIEYFDKSKKCELTKIFYSISLDK